MLGSFAGKPGSTGVRMLDFRNSRYQGEMDSSGQPHGVGLLLEQSYLLALGKWKERQATESVFLLFPDSSIFYGQLRKGVPDGICTFQTRQSLKIHIMFDQRDWNHILIDNPHTKEVTLMKISR